MIILCKQLWKAALILLITLVVPLETFAEPRNTKIIEELQQAPMELINDKVKEEHPFYGLASYYQGISYYIVNFDSTEYLTESESTTLTPNQWLAIVGRFNVLAIQAPNLTLQLDEDNLTIDNPEVLNNSDVTVALVEKPNLMNIAPELDQLRYAHLWQPLAWLSKLMETALVFIHTHLIANWALAIIIFAITLRLLLLPVNLFTARIQRNVDTIKSKLTPKLDEIKAQFKGLEAHERIMAAHKELGVSTFYSLKPMIGPLIQIPLLIAIFNAMGEMPQFTHSSIWWIWDWAYPDTVAMLPFSLPLFGNELNLLPFLMTAVTVLSAIIYQNPQLPPNELRKTKRNIYLMAFGFFLLFYSFPAAMVFFWMVMNVLQTAQQRIMGG